MSVEIARPDRLSVLRVNLAQQRRALVWWAIAIALMALLFAAVYPSVRDSGDTFDDYLEQLPDAFRSILGEDLTSPAGYLWSQLFSSMGPIVYLVYAIGAGARAIAGEEEAGSLDLVLATPLRRTVVLRDKALGLVSGTVLLSAVLFVALAILGPAFDMTVPLGDLLAAHAVQALLSLAFGMIALAIGAATGARALAIGVTSALAVLTYLLWALAPSVDALEPVLPLSPFRWFADPQPVAEGTELVNVVVLAAISAVAYAIGLVTFRERDLAT
ncbi:MAG TPA: ABC transporter permease subunit [Actinomycetota bacterium]|nr:ABC transporter permease subunit [Actinomycetota bacterium]